jgi:hypothetical protein
VTTIVTTTVTAQPITVTATRLPEPTSAKPSPQDGTPPRRLAVGAPVVVTNSKGTATVTLNSAERKPAAGSEYADPPKNENYVLLDVNVTNEGTDGTSSYHTFDRACATLMVTNTTWLHSRDTIRN